LQLLELLLAYYAPDFAARLFSAPQNEEKANAMASSHTGDGLNALQE
jgi:hypothetical protein